jgi:AraC family transcriptional regulator
MARDLGNVATTSRFAVRPPGMHLLGHDAGFRARDCVCGHGVRSPVLEGQFVRAQIAVLLVGTFHVRSSTGAAVVGPGGLVLGNPATAYEVRHPVDGGDRSLVFDYDDAVLDELAGSLPRRGARRFDSAAVPASPAGLEAIVLAEQALRSRDAQALQEAALGVALLAFAVERRLPSSPPSHVQARRVARALRYIDAHSAGDCSLEVLASEARLSRYHFLRVFRAMTGQTPRQYVIATRLRVAAAALRASRTPITRIAIDAGFGDLSHFIASFARAFGISPAAYRRRATRATSR